MVMLAQKLSRLPASRVIGTGTMLDSARFKTILSRQLGISTRSITSYVLGEHGDSSVVNWSSVCIGGIGLDDFCKQTKLSLPMTTRKTIEHRVKNAAYEIIQGRGATWDGIGAAVADLLYAIINDERRILTTSIVDSLGKNAVAVSLPRVVGNDGVLMTLKSKMNIDETTNLRKSAKIIRRNFDLI
jgi:L-lactate dehydrogenase